MDKDELTKRVDEIIDLGRTDDEAAHGEEDELILQLLTEYAPAEVIAEVDRLGNAPFQRWYA